MSINVELPSSEQNLIEDQILELSEKRLDADLMKKTTTECQNITELKLTACSFDCTDFTLFEKLKTLRFYHCHKLSDNKLYNLELPKSIKTLIFVECWSIQGSGLGNLKKIKNIRFERCYELRELFPSLNGCRSTLEHLSLVNCGNVKSLERRSIKKAKKLKSLQISDCMGATADLAACLNSSKKWEELIRTRKIEIIVN